MENFGGYTAQAGNIIGYWREEDGRDSYEGIANSASPSPTRRTFLGSSWP
jgi:hypothetical protein